MRSLLGHAVAKSVGKVVSKAKNAAGEGVHYFKNIDAFYILNIKIITYNSVISLLRAISVTSKFKDGADSDESERSDGENDGGDAGESAQTTMSLVRARHHKKGPFDFEGVCFMFNLISPCMEF